MLVRLPSALRQVPGVVVVWVVKQAVMLVVSRSVGDSERSRGSFPTGGADWPGGSA